MPRNAELLEMNVSGVAGEELDSVLTIRARERKNSKGHGLVWQGMDGLMEYAARYHHVCLLRMLRVYLSSYRYQLIHHAPPGLLETGC